MEQTQQMINVGSAYLDAVNNLKEDQPQEVAQILEILNCIHPVSGYHFGIYIEEPSPFGAVTHACDQSWFHCYQGKEEPIMRRPYTSPKWKDGDSEDTLYLRFTFEMFEHLHIEPSLMGAWQAYLLCISKTLLPFSGILYYTKRKLIMSNDQLRDIRPLLRLKIIPELENLEVDVAPSVTIDGNNALVSCCYWNDWGGLIREYVPVFFNNDRVRIGDFHDEVLIKFDCGIMF